jgi:hypothetical protein
VSAKSDDTQYYEADLTGVEEYPEGWAISGDYGTLFIPKVEGIVPKVGSIARYYGKGFGFSVRGVDIDGQEVYYRTEEEQKENHRREQEKWHQEKKDQYEREGKAILDAQYATLPLLFQQRLDRFRATKADFRWEMEPYEMSCCVDAVLMARHARFDLDDLRRFQKLPWRDQKEEIPDLEDGHSGNSWGTAVMLANVYIEAPKFVPLAHGGLCGLLGCTDYGHRLATKEEIAEAQSTKNYFNVTERLA